MFFTKHPCLSVPASQNPSDLSTRFSTACGKLPFHLSNFAPKCRRLQVQPMTKYATFTRFCHFGATNPCRRGSKIAIFRALWRFLRGFLFFHTSFPQGVEKTCGKGHFGGKNCLYWVREIWILEKFGSQNSGILHDFFLTFCSCQNVSEIGILRP